MVGRNLSVVQSFVCLSYHRCSVSCPTRVDTECLDKELNSYEEVRLGLIKDSSLMLAVAK